MNQKELKELIEFLVEKDIAEFSLERGDVKVHVRRGAAEVRTLPAETHYLAMPPAAPLAAPAAALPPPALTPGPPPPPVASAPAAAPPSAEVGEEAGVHIVRSPIVGTFYEAPSPGAPPFVKVGDTVSGGQVLCIIEAMKLMNEIESDYAGEIVKKYVTNAQPVEYGQPLFAIRAQ